jgi:hypothetical protein
MSATAGLAPIIVATEFLLGLAVAAVIFRSRLRIRLAVIAMFCAGAVFICASGVAAWADLSTSFVEGHVMAAAPWSNCPRLANCIADNRLALCISAALSRRPSPACVWGGGWSRQGSTSGQEHGGHPARVNSDSSAIETLSTPAELMVLLESKLNTLHDEVDQLFGAITQVTAYALQEFVERWPGYGPRADFRPNGSDENSLNWHGAKFAAIILSLLPTCNFSLDI